MWIWGYKQIYQTVWIVKTCDIGLCDYYTMWYKKKSKYQKCNKIKCTSVFMHHAHDTVLCLHCWMLALGWTGINNVASYNLPFFFFLLHSSSSLPVWWMDILEPHCAALLFLAVTVWGMLFLSFSYIIPCWPWFLR